MKKVIILIAMLFCVAASATAETIAGKVVVGGSLAGGITYPEFSSDYGYTSDLAVMSAAGVTLGYCANDFIMFLGGIEYADKYFGANNFDDWVRYEYTVIDFKAGLRFIYLVEVGGFYGDLGLFYGKPTGDVKWESYQRGNSNTGKLDNSYVNDDYGMILGVGYIYLVNEQIWLDLGLRYEQGFSKIIGWSTASSSMSIKSRSLSLNVGVSYALSL